jgi:formylmethanofuran dehydrogenase subunit C
LLGFRFRHHRLPHHQAATRAAVLPVGSITVNYGATMNVNSPAGAGYSQLNNLTVSGSFNQVSGSWPWVVTYNGGTADVTSTGEMSLSFATFNNASIIVDGVVTDNVGIENSGGSITVNSDGTWYEYGVDSIDGSVTGIITYV